MSKQNGLGDNFYIGGYDLSGDVSALSSVHGGPAAMDVTAINKSAYERIGGLRDGGIDFSSWFDPDASSVVGEHTALSTLPTADVIACYFVGTAIGNPAACEVSRQTNYDPTRGNDGSLAFAVSTVADGYGLEWGNQLTAGVRTDTAATNGSSWDTGASKAFGAQAYLQVFSFTGTDVTVKIQDSADNSTFADVTSLAFAQITGTTPQAQRIAIGNTATVRRYLRASTVTSGGVTSVAFAVAIVKNTIAGQVF